MWRVSFYSLFAALKKSWSHEVLNGRANINCVISSSPTTGLRTIHLLRSILFRALPSHAIPADHPERCLHHHLNVTFGRNLSSGRAQLRRHAVAACFPIAAEIPCGFHEACRSCSLTQFNLPVVMSMMKHSWFKKKSVKTLFHQRPPAPCLPSDAGLYFLFIGLFLHF